LREEGLAEGREARPTQRFWSLVGGLSGGAMGFIVANFPGAIAGAVAGNRLGAVRDARGKSVYSVFQVSCRHFWRKGPPATMLAYEGIRNSRKVTRRSSSASLRRRCLRMRLGLECGLVPVCSSRKAIPVPALMFASCRGCLIDFWVGCLMSMGTVVFGRPIR